MNITVLGTGMVGRAHAARLAELGHEVTIGTRNVQTLLEKTTKDTMGNEPFNQWYKSHSTIQLKSFGESVNKAEIIINALNGEVTIKVLKTLGQDLAGKILIDITNPLDFSKGMPPFLFVANTDSLGEQIQNALPQVKVVKAFNTMNALLQVDPIRLANGEHTLFISGNDADSKSKLIELAKGYGWKDIIDLGDITTARGTEMYLPLWLRLWGNLQTPNFNVRIIVERNT